MWSLGQSLSKKGPCLCTSIYSEGPCRGIHSCLMWFLLLRELFEVCQVFPAWLNWREGRIVCEEKEGREGGGWKGVEGSALECLSTSALRPSAETGTLWEQACSGVFYVQCMEGELRGQIASSNWNTSGLLGCLVFSTRLTHYLWFPPFLAFILCLTSTAMTVLFWADSCATLG